MSVSEKAANFPTDRCEVCGREPPRVMTPNEARAKASPTPDEDLRDIYLAMQAADDERNRLSPEVELLSDLFDFLGGVDGAADLRERLLVKLRHHELAALTADDGDERHSSTAE